MFSERRDIVLDCVELDPSRLDVPFHELSQGERKKVSIAVALFQCQSLVVLDEPFSGFDKNYGQRLAAKLSELPFTKIITTTENHQITYKVLKRNQTLNI